MVNDGQGVTKRSMNGIEVFGRALVKWGVWAISIEISRRME
jgi:hypothetical protein